MLRGLLVLSMLAASAAVLRGGADEAAGGRVLSAADEAVSAGQCICERSEERDGHAVMTTTSVNAGDCPFFKLGATCAPGVAITLGEFGTRMNAHADFTPLKAALGTAQAQAYVGMLYDKMLHCHDALGVTDVKVHEPCAPAKRAPTQPSAAILLRGADVATLDTYLGALMYTELRILASQKKYITELFAEAAAGLLRARALAGDAAERKPWAEALAWTQPSGQYALTPAKAAEWAAAVATLRNGGWMNVGALKSCSDALMRISGVTPMAYRPPPTQGKYGSSILDATLLPFIVDLAGKFPAQAAGADANQDLALFMLAALGHGQTFADGNKRMTRVVYYAVMADKFLPPPATFVAPKGAVAQELYNM